MTNTKFDELLDQAIELYLKKENERLEEESKDAEKYKFSERHERKMKELFDGLIE